MTRGTLRRSSVSAMSFAYGPVDLYLVGFENEVDRSALQALADLTKTGVVRLIDLVAVEKTEDGDVTVLEIADHIDEYGFEEFDADAVGLTGEEDIAELAESLAPGTSAVIVALEQTYARDLAEKLAAGGGELLRYERIPAPIVNAVMDLADDDA